VTAFERRYRNDETGRLAYDPKVLLKIVLYGYAKGLVSSCKLASAVLGAVGASRLANAEEGDGERLQDTGDLNQRVGEVENVTPRTRRLSGLPS